LQKVIYILIIFILVAGCAVSRKAELTGTETEVPSALIIENIVSNNLTNNDFIIQKAEIEINNQGSESSFLASIKYKKERKYLLSIRTKAGIEVARIFITGDTILANDRINKKLYYGSPEYLEKKYGISIASIPVVLGDLLIDYYPGNGNLQCRNGKAGINGTIENKEISYIIDCREKKIEEVKYRNNPEASQIEIIFRDFGKIDYCSYPSTIELKDHYGGSSIKISIKKISLNPEEELKFIPGTNYEEIMLK
jgi:hypothetical protein